MAKSDPIQYDGLFIGQDDQVREVRFTIGRAMHGGCPTLDNLLGGMTEGYAIDWLEYHGYKIAIFVHDTMQRGDRFNSFATKLYHKSSLVGNAVLVDDEKPLTLKDYEKLQSILEKSDLGAIHRAIASKIDVMVENAQNEDWCGNPGCKKRSKLKACSRCHKEQYCSVSCQRSNWGNHRHLCIKL